MALKHRVKEQLSSNIVDKYPDFVLFLESYYEWLENNSYGKIKDHMSYYNLEKTLTEYQDYLKNELLPSFPKDVLADKSLLLKFSKQINSIRGTKKSFQFLFRVLYNEDIDLFFPKDYLFRLSHGKWISDESVMYVTNRGNSSTWLYKQIKQVQDDGNGNITYAYAVVDRIESRYINKFNVVILHLSNVEGTFDKTNTISTIDTDYEYVIPVGLNYSISSGGTNYQINDTFKTNYSGYFIKSGFVNGELKFDTRLTSAFNKSDLVVVHNLFELDQADYNFDGQYITSNLFSEGDGIEVSFPVYNGFYAVSQIEDGVITKLKPIDPSIGLPTSPSALVATNSDGTGAIITITNSNLFKLEGYYFNDDGFLSSVNKLQDSDLWQDFSYVIKTTQDINKYADIVKKLLHPSGCKMFGQINIQQLINYFIQYSDEIEFKPYQIFIASEVSVGPRYQFVERFKYSTDSTLYKTKHFLSIKTGDVISNWMSGYRYVDLNIEVQDTSPEITTIVGSNVMTTILGAEIIRIIQ